MSSPGGTTGGSGDAMVSLIAHFNNIALHAIAISLSVADNALMQFAAASAGGANLGTGSRIVTINHPLPRSLQTKTNNALTTAAMNGKC